MTLMFNTLFAQRDVRETPTSTATATAVGLVDEPYVLVSAGGADLTEERVLTAGEGIDLTDGGAGTTITVSCEDATDGGNKGIASFHPDDFDVTSGAVTIDDSGVNHDATTNFVANEHLDWTGDRGANNIHVNNITAVPEAAVTNHEGAIDHDALNNFAAGEHFTMLDEDNFASDSNTKAATQQSIKAYITGLGGGTMDDFTLTADSGSNQTIADGNTLDIEGGEGINTVVGATDKVTISGELATTTNKGVASFNTNDFTVSSGAVSLKNKTSYWSCTGANFTSDAPDTDTVSVGATFLSQGTGIFCAAPVFIPNGAVITGVIVYGNISDETWTLWRRTLANETNTQMATAVFNTEDTSIDNATVDNSLYAYTILTTGIDNNDEIWGARVKYTTDFD